MTAEVPNNALGEHAERLIADVLDKREQAIITSVAVTLANGKVLEPQFAIQKWIEFYEARKLRSTLIQRSKLENSRIAAQG